MTCGRGYFAACTRAMAMAVAALIAPCTVEPWALHLSHTPPRKLAKHGLRAFLPHQGVTTAALNELPGNLHNSMHGLAALFHIHLPLSYGYTLRISYCVLVNVMGSRQCVATMLVRMGGGGKCRLHNCVCTSNGWQALYHD